MPLTIGSLGRSPSRSPGGEASFSAGQSYADPLVEGGKEGCSTLPGLWPGSLWTFSPAALKWHLEKVCARRWWGGEGCLSSARVQHRHSPGIWDQLARWLHSFIQ